jgi:hypothetical protein
MILASASGGDIVMSVAAAGAYLVPAAVGQPAEPAGGARPPCWPGCCTPPVLAWMLFGETPRFGFAPALSVTAWLVLTVYAVERQLYPAAAGALGAGRLGAAAVLLALVFPGTPLHVSASPWLPLHWALGIASYGLFAAAVLHAWLLRAPNRHIRQRRRTAGRPAAAHAGAPDVPLRRRRLRAALGHAAGRHPVQRAVRPRLALGPQDGVLGAGLGAFALLLLGRARFGWRGRTATACSTPAPSCCCWRTWARASCWKWSWAHRMKYLLIAAGAAGRLPGLAQRAPARRAHTPPPPAPAGARAAAGDGALPRLRPAPAAPTRCRHQRPAVLQPRAPQRQAGGN